MFNRKDKFDALKFQKDKSILRKNYNNKFEYTFDKKTNLIPKKDNRLLIIMFSENKSCRFIYRKFEQNIDTFRYNGGLYIINNESIHITKAGNRVCFYLEGISTPIKMSNIEKETIEVDYYDLDGNLKSTSIEKIKGLKYDSKILDIVCDRKLSENFTQIEEKFKFGFLMLIFIIINMIMVGIGIAVSYYYR